MSLRLKMLQVARLAPKLLGESAALVEQFFLSQQNDGGGFKNRAGESDLYYTVFGLEGLLALRASRTGPEAGFLEASDPVARRARSFLARFDGQPPADLVHLCALARAWRSVNDAPQMPAQFRQRIFQMIERFRSADGGYHSQPASPRGSAYACFLAIGACQDLDQPLRNAPRLRACLDQLRTADGGWANEAGMAVGATNATAAALAGLEESRWRDPLSESSDARSSANLSAPQRSLATPDAARVGQWLLARLHPQGGFVASPQTPMPDLLSTATALHALASLDLPLDSVKEKCLDFIDSLWTNQGGFYGHWGDDHLDVEYSFYALLSLGHLAL